mgnify:CR=1 FL=1
MSSSGPLLSVVMPAYNEEAAIESAVSEVVKEVLSRVAPSELVVVDDGSRDSTENTVKHFREHHGNVRYFRQENRGQGIAGPR